MISLEEYFAPDVIYQIYAEEIEPRGGRGIDRRGTEHFSRVIDIEVSTIIKKCLDGTYRFSPYMERLMLRGKGRIPRVISIPTIRDRIVLAVLKRMLHDAFPECVHRRLPNAYIRDIKSEIADFRLVDSHFYKTDISNFFGSICHNLLFANLRERINEPKMISLIGRAIRTPTVPKGYSRKEQKMNRRNQGIPQGIAISTILSNIYLSSFDSTCSEFEAVYKRYVDDMLFLFDGQILENFESNLVTKLERIGLELNEDKTNKGHMSDGIDYLGYRLELPKVTLRKSTVEKYISSIATLFTTYKYAEIQKMGRYGEHDMDIRNRLFLADLNERITGAVNEKNQYGWIFYFLELTDISILYHLDLIINGMFSRLKGFGKKTPSGLKRLVKAFHEAKYNRQGGYIHNYNFYDSTEKELTFLISHGYINPDAKLNESQVHKLFLSVRHERLSNLEKDVGFTS